MKEKTYECEVKSQFKPMETSSVVISAAAAHRRQKVEKTYEIVSESLFKPMEALNVAIPAAAVHRRQKMKEETYECEVMSQF